jgi:hypothetical protein
MKQDLSSKIVHKIPWEAWHYHVELLVEFA